MPVSANPVLNDERSDILDVLRGFALFGILLDNIFGFTGYGFFDQAQREALATWPADGLLGLFELAFIKGKFYSLFSLLFGIGFSIIMVRNEKRGINPLRIFYRRLFILLFIGAAHLYFLWEGDILLLYAMLGMLLPLFRKCSDKALLTWAAVLILSPILIDSIKVLFHVRTGDFLRSIGMSIDKSTGVPADDASVSQYLFKKGSGWTEWRNWQQSGFFWRYSDLIESNRMPKVLGMFLLGFYAGRKMIYADPENYVPMFKKIRRWGFLIGIPCSIAMVYFYIDDKNVPKAIGLLDTLFYAFSVVPLSLAYVSTFCLYWIKKKGNSKLKILAPVGKMALTNYIMQTTMGIIIFYGVGFGFGGRVGPSIFYPVAIGMYLLQVLYSNTWFRYFNYGPLEWIWRQLTYGKRLPLRKVNKI
ncbi:MAG TPA: DUF418 domain-containing protein [Ferruginibacter sp.]|nr:DUF418 domain-containing protein [Ferruginibacter sp.]